MLLDDVYLVGVALVGRFQFYSCNFIQLADVLVLALGYEQLHVGLRTRFIGLAALMLGLLVPLT